MGIVTLQCSCCGKRRSVVYTAFNLASIINDGWGSYGSALYCPKCTRTWEDRNGTNRPMPGKFNTLRIIDELYIESAPKTVTEYCSECETENTMVWDVKTEGYKAYCPHCGKVMMLCDAYHLVRDKSAFAIGTISIDDFEEFDEDTTHDIAEYIFKQMNEPFGCDAQLLNVGDPIMICGYISKVEILTDVVRYYLENGAVVEMERKK